MHRKDSRIGSNERAVVMAVVMAVLTLAALVVLSVAYVLFKKKYYWMHEEYLRGIGK